MAELARVRAHSLGVVHTRNFSLFLSNFAMALWYITPTQGFVVASNLEIERAFRPSRLDHGNRILRHLAGLRVHLAEEHLAEVGVPDLALAIEHHVVRLDQGIRQVVFRDDYAR